MLMPKRIRKPKPRKNTRRWWTPDEDAGLLAAPCMAEWGRRNNRTEAACQCRKKALEEHGRFATGGSLQRWTPEEDARLLEGQTVRGYIPDASRRRMLALGGPQEEYQRARHNEPWTKKEIESLREAYDLGVWALEHGRTYTASRAQLFKHSPPGSLRWTPEEHASLLAATDLEAWAKEHRRSLSACVQRAKRKGIYHRTGERGHRRAWTPEEIASLFAAPDIEAWAEAHGRPLQSCIYRIKKGGAI